MKNRWTLAIDLGSTTTKVALFDEKLASIWFASNKTPTRRSGERVEIDTERLYKTTYKELKRLAKELGKDLSNVSAAAITGQRSTTAFWSADQVLMPALSWQDLRANDRVEEYVEHAEAIAKRTGLVLSPNYAALKIQWALEQNRLVKQAARKHQLLVGSLPTYFIWRLTEGKTYAVDHTLAQRTLLLNIATRRWDPFLTKLFNIPIAILPSLKSSIDDYGSFTLSGHKIPIRVCVGDTQAACVATGFGKHSKVAIQYGSGAFLNYFTGGSLRRCNQLLTSIYYSKGRETKYLIEGAVNSAATLTTWAKKNKKIPFVKMHLPQSVLLPALSGLAAPHWESKLTPAVFGTKPPKNLAKLAPPAIAYRFREILAWLTLHGFTLPKSLLVSGGLCNQRAFVKMQADILQKPVVTVSLEEGTLRGACLLLKKRHEQEKGRAATFRPRKKPYLKPTEWQRVVRHAKHLKEKPWFKRSLWCDKLSESKTLVLGHRGAPKKAPENTLSSLLQAVEFSADGVECDVRLSKDGLPVLMHDKDLQRTTDGRGRLDSKDYHALSKLDAGSWFGKPFAGEKIPCLEDVIRELPRDTLMYIEIKDEIGQLELWRKVTKLVDQTNSRGRICLCSYNIKRSLQLKRERQDLLVGAIIGSRHPALPLSEPLYPELDIISLRYNRFHSNLLDFSRQAAQLFFVWTVDRLQVAKRFSKVDVDGIVTNRPEVITRKSISC